MQQLESTYGKEEIILKSEPNNLVCDKIKKFVETRYIADPLIPKAGNMRQNERQE